MNENAHELNLFDRHDPLWNRVSKKYAIVDLLINLFFAVVMLTAAALIFNFSDPKNTWVPLVALSLIAVINFVNIFLAFRRVRAIGYILLEDELVFRRGIMFDRIVSVPYGRLQIVDITRGPLLRAVGLATLKFVTAAQTTGVQLPGLQLKDAEELRDRLVALAETRRSGL